MRFAKRHPFLKKNVIGDRQIAAGETTTHEDAKQRLQKWLAGLD
jgi:hypothetical protein